MHANAMSDLRFTSLINEPNFEISKEPDPETDYGWMFGKATYRRDDGKYTYADAPTQLAIIHTTPILRS